MFYCSVDFFFFKQKTAYEMRISDWSSDVCSSDLGELIEREADARGEALRLGDRLAVIAEQPRHLGGRFQMPFGMGGETLAGMIDRHAEPDAGDDIVQRSLIGRGVERIIGGEHRHTCFARRAGETGEAAGESGREHA